MIREGVKLPKGIQNRIPELIELIGSDKDIVALYSFGSLARNKLNPLSDLDFGILLSSRMDKKQRYEKHLDLIGTFTSVLKTDEIDLIILNQATTRFAFQILKTGKLLFCNDRPTLIKFCEHVVKYYLDFKVLRDTFDEAFLKGVGYHG
jgi:predicted nucleotidyltransferase